MTVSKYSLQREVETNDVYRIDKKIRFHVTHNLHLRALAVVLARSRKNDGAMSYEALLQTLAAINLIQPTFNKIPSRLQHLTPPSPINITEINCQIDMHPPLDGVAVVDRVFSLGVLGGGSILKLLHLLHHCHLLLIHLLSDHGM